MLDPFLGSGTTLLACVQTGRVGFGMELDPYYVDVAIRRWQSMTGSHAVLADNNCSFDQIMATRTEFPDHEANPKENDHDAA